MKMVLKHYKIFTLLLLILMLAVYMLQPAKQKPMLFERLATTQQLAPATQTTGQLTSLLQPLLAAHPQQSGAYVLELGMEALLARAWLTDHAQKSIDVQYFIWSADNIGVLGSEALLRAADRGVKVRVIVDDFLMLFPDKMLLALAQHPNIDIKIYNPKHSVAVLRWQQLYNLASNFKGTNQRMHDKTFIVDGQIGITGGRNMANEYFNFNHTYNFRDRDVLLVGNVVGTMQHSFNQFWQSPISQSVEALLAEPQFGQAKPNLTASQAQTIYAQLHRYANNPRNYEPAIRNAVNALPKEFKRLTMALHWAPMEFIYDLPGKNNSKQLTGGGQSTTQLAQLLATAKHEVLIQSPYMVIPAEGLHLFANAIKRGVKVKVVTNSMASTDNYFAFSGYRKQRAQLLKLGIMLYEYKPNAQIRETLLQSPVVARHQPPIFSIHAKTMVVDGQHTYIGTFNLDPRSANLNTEVGVIINSAALSAGVKQAIEQDMLAQNSWNAQSDNPDQYAPRKNHIMVRLGQLLPLTPIL